MCVCVCERERTQTRKIYFTRIGERERDYLNPVDLPFAPVSTFVSPKSCVLIVLSKFVSHLIFHSITSSCFYFIFLLFLIVGRETSIMVVGDLATVSTADPVRGKDSVRFPWTVVS